MTDRPNLTHASAPAPARVPTAAEVLSFVDYFAGQENTADEVRDFVQKAARAIEEIWTFAEWQNEPDLAGLISWLQEREP